MPKKLPKKFLAMVNVDMDEWIRRTHPENNTED